MKWDIVDELDIVDEMPIFNRQLLKWTYTKDNFRKLIYANFNCIW